MNPLIHFELTLQERRAIPGSGYVHASDFRDHPEMVCRTGDGHAIGTRVPDRVTCLVCLTRLGQVA